MSAPYKEAKPGRLVFKGGEAASLSKKKHKKSSKSKSKPEPSDEGLPEGATPAADPSDGGGAGEGGGGAGGDVYTIDAAKKMKYEELFPVEAKKFKYDPKNASRSAGARTVEESLDDRVRKKADRYCK